MAQKAQSRACRTCVRARNKAILRYWSGPDGNPHGFAFIDGDARSRRFKLRFTWLAGVCLTLIFGAAEVHAADAKVPPPTASQKAAIDRAYAILQDTRDHQAMERLERRVPDRFSRARRPRQF